MKITLDELIPAKSLEVIEAEAKVPNKVAHKIRKDLTAKLVAQEYVRNGMDLVAAYRTVVGKKYAGKSTGIMSILGSSTDVFVAELARITERSDIDRDRALNILWTMVNTSILDFIDDEGNVLPIAELKKLPHVVQLMISKVSVVTNQEPVKDKAGNPLLDDNGSPYLKTSSKVRIEVPERLAAMNQLAQLMRWIGPTTIINTNINIAQIMSDADARRSRVSDVYDNATGKLDN